MVDPNTVRQVLYQLDVIPVDETDIDIRRSSAKVFVNGSIMGYCGTPKELVDQIRKKRRTGELSTEINVAYFSHEARDSEEVYISCDQGRVRRPLVLLENGVPKLKSEHVEKVRSGEWNWSDLIQKGILEYIDAEEE